MVIIDEAEPSVKNDRSTMRRLIVDGLKVRGGTVEAPNWEHLLHELGLPVCHGNKRQWRKALFSLRYKYGTLRVIPFRRDGERWGRYYLK